MPHLYSPQGTIVHRSQGAAAVAQGVHTVEPDQASRRVREAGLWTAESDGESRQGGT